MEVIYTKRASKDLAGLPAQVKKRILPALEAISNEPLSGKKLQGPLASYRSLRIGEYRIIYQMVAEPVNQVIILTVSPRGGAYKT